MDLSISPDWDARLCYGVVLLCGLIAARIQIYKRFVELNITGVWLVPSTWLMFGLYLFTPLGLFWLMDRTSALSDTSLVAALLVGFAYPAILAGGFGGLKAPGGLGDILKPVQALIDTVIKSVTKAVARQEKRFEDFVVGRMTGDPAVFDHLLDLAKRGAVDVPALEKQLSDLEASPPADPSLLREKKARIIYLYLSATPDAVAAITRDTTLMKDRWWNSPVYRSRVVVGLVTLLFAGALVGGVYTLSRPSVSLAYHVWRLGKANNSERDRFRARENLRVYLQDTNLNAAGCQMLARAIRMPGLPVQRVDMFLQLLLQARDQPSLDALLCGQLIDALRVDSVDARSRVHQALVLLATKRDPQFKEKEKELATWNPSTGDSVPSLEDWVGRWRAFFSQAASAAK